MGVSATIHPVLSASVEHTTSIIRSVADKISCLAGSCAELNLLEEYRALSDATRRLQSWRASIAIVGSRHTGKTALIALLNALRGICSGDHLEFTEVRLEDNSPIPACDIVLLLVSARAPLFDGALQFLKRVRNPENLIIVVTQMASFQPAQGEAIVEHVAAGCGGLRVIGVDSEAGSSIVRLESELHALVIRKSIAPHLDRLAGEALRICDTVQNAASFNERALRAEAGEYERTYRSAVSDLGGLGRAIAALEQSVAQNDAKLQALIPRLTSGILTQMEQAADERIESPATPGITAITAPIILAAANEAAMRVFERLQEYALKEFKHALALAISELDRIRSAAEIRVQEITHNFLGPAIAFSLIGPEPLSRSLDQVAPGMDDWLSAHAASFMKSLAAPPVYRQQALDSLRQLFLSALKYSIRQHWEASGSPDDILKTVLTTALQQFFRSPVEELQKEMVRIHKALENCFSSRRLDLLTQPSLRSTRALLADLNADRQRQCEELREYTQRVAMELKP